MVVLTIADQKSIILIIRSLYVYNKIDSIGMEHLDKLAREPYTAVMSCELDLGVDWVVDRCWEMLQLIRVYTKRYFTPLPFPSSRSLRRLFSRPHPKCETDNVSEKELTPISRKHLSYALAPLSKTCATKSIGH
jgi:hypothetical protein